MDLDADGNTLTVCSWNVCCFKCKILVSASLYAGKAIRSFFCVFYHQLRPSGFVRTIKLRSCALTIPSGFSRRKSTKKMGIIPISTDPTEFTFHNICYIRCNFLGGAVDYSRSGESVWAANFLHLCSQVFFHTSTLTTHRQEQVWPKIAEKLEMKKWNTIDNFGLKWLDK